MESALLMTTKLATRNVHFPSKMCIAKCLFPIPARCLCNTGFAVDPSNSSSCVDFDECLEHTNSCQQRCVNSPGSFRCDCQEGYTVSREDPAACVPIEEEKQR